MSADVSADELWSKAVPDPEATLAGTTETEEPPHPTVIGHLLKSLSPGQDLTRVTIPAFFLEPRSLLERLADTLLHPDLILQASKAKTPLERITGVVRWFLSGFHYKTLGVQKPFNPIIGETFACFWDHSAAGSSSSGSGGAAKEGEENDGSKSQYFAEQVSHRPPVSAIYFENAQNKIKATAHVWTKSQFSAPQTVKSILEGACYLNFQGLDEEYIVTFPTYYAHNLLIGTLRMDIGDTARVICVKTGLRADIEFCQMGTFSSSDKLHAVEGTIRTIPEGASTAVKKGGWFSKGGLAAEGEVLAKITGHYKDVLYVTPTETGKQEILVDIKRCPIRPKRVLPISLQGPWESRRLWQFATEQLLRRPLVDWEAVDREKAQLEEEQRLVPCHAFKPGHAGHEEWKTKKFHLRKLPDVVGGTAEGKEHYVFDGFDCGVAATAPAIGHDAPAAAGSGSASAGPLNVLQLSRTLPDTRGGLHGAGANAEQARLLKTITLSAKRQAEGWEKF